MTPPLVMVPSRTPRTTLTGYFITVAQSSASQSRPMRYAVISRTQLYYHSQPITIETSGVLGHDDRSLMNDVAC